MDKVKVINKKTGVVKEVKKTLAGDFVGTHEWEVYTKPEKKIFNVKENKEEN